MQIYVHKNTYIYAELYVSTHVCMFTNENACIYMYIKRNIDYVTGICVCVNCMQVFTFVSMCVCLHVNICLHVYIYLYIHACMHIYVYS